MEKNPVKSRILAGFGNHGIVTTIHRIVPQTLSNKLEFDSKLA